MSAADQIQSFRNRFQNLFTAEADIKADIKELRLEIKAHGLNVQEIEKWAKAELAGGEKLVKRINSAVDAVIYGEALGHNLGNVLGSDETENRASLNGSKFDGCGE